MRDEVVRLAIKHCTEVLMAKAHAVHETSRLMMGYLETNQRANVLYALGQLEIIIQNDTENNTDELDLIVYGLMEKAPYIYSGPIMGEDAPEPPDAVMDVFKRLKERVLESAQAAGMERAAMDPDWLKGRKSDG